MPPPRRAGYRTRRHAGIIPHVERHPPLLTERLPAVLLDRALRPGRRSLRARIARLRDKGWHVAQAAVAAGVAWWIAADVLGHHMPFFAPIAAVVSLGTSYSQRLRRVAEVTAGVAIGVFLADNIVHQLGTGAWQMAMIVALSMSAALLLDAGVLLVAQAAVVSIVVTIFVAPPGYALTRWSDAVIGGAVALVAATVVPQAPLRRPRDKAANAVDAVARILRRTASSAATGDIHVSAEVLDRARDVDGVLRELMEASEEGRSALRSSPFRRRHRDDLDSIADVVVHITRSLRSSRWLIRRVVVAAYHGEDIPRSYATLIDETAAATEQVADALRHDTSMAEARNALARVAARTARVTRTSLLSSEVILAQLRSTIVELLQVTGLEMDDAVGALPVLRERMGERPPDVVDGDPDAHAPVVDLDHPDAPGTPPSNPSR